VEPKRRTAETVNYLRLAEEAGREGAKFQSVRRAFRVLDLVSRRQGLTAKLLARELGVSLSTCYYLINILIEEGCLEKDPVRRGYRIGAAVGALHERSCGERFSSTVEPVLEDLARRSGRHAYLGVMLDGAVTVSRVKSPFKSPPVGIVQGFHGASHALALGKVLIAGAGAEGLRDYLEGYGLEPFTPRTIVRPELFEVHLDRVRVQGVATDVGEFEENLCCVAAPITSESGAVEGAVGVSTSGQRFGDEAGTLVELVRWGADEASKLLREEG
jgi:DNA-binding IclR family transcriptional regulator